jgi:hypothetical protein
LVGSLVFGFDGMGSIWNDALADSSVLSYQSGGQVQVLTILDKRWKWIRRYVSGSYNVRMPDGSIEPSSEKTLAELATLLFTLMGEPGANVSAITSTEKPEVFWDYDNAADELDKLLNDRGYIVSLTQAGTAIVYAVGAGASIPNNGDVTSVSFLLNPAEIPNTVRAITKPTTVQSKLKLIPVGLETDGSIKDVEDLSYKPAGGWDGTSFDDFSNISDPDDRAVAMRSVGRWYRISTQADDTHNISGGGVNYSQGEVEITHFSQYLPLREFLIDSYADDGWTDRKIGSLPYVEGKYFYKDSFSIPPVERNTPDFTRMASDGYRIGRRDGIVRFYDLVLKRKDGGLQMTFADLYLVCAYSVTVAGWTKDRHHMDLALGGFGDDVVDVPIGRSLTCRYAEDGTTISSITDTKATVESVLEEVLNNKARSYVTASGTVVRYRGIYPLEVDGVSTEILWKCNHGESVPFSTEVSQHRTGLPYLTKKSRKDRHRNVRRTARQSDSSRRKQARTTLGLEDE